MSVRLLLITVALLAFPARAQSPVLDLAYGDDGFGIGHLATPSKDLDHVVFSLRDDGAAYYTTVQYDDTKTPSSYFSRVGLLTPDGQDDASFGEHGVHVVELPGIGQDGAVTRTWAMAADARGRAPFWQGVLPSW